MCDISTIPSENIKPTFWQLCNATNAGDFTAVGYFFAKKLQQELNVPIGIINSSWGGTMIETWISKKALIYPLANFSIRDVIWYQGESNADRAAQYVTSFPMLIKNWRSSFKQPLLPLYFVQLTSFNANNKNSTGGSKGQSYEKRN